VCLDAIVIGGGPAGLSAATWLARYRRTVLVLDSGEYRNRWADASHGYLSRDRASPAELLTRARVTRHSDLVDGHHRRPAAVAAPGPGGGQPSGCAFADEVAFEVGQGGEDVEDELAAGGGGVDRLLEAAEPDPAISQPSDRVDQVAQGAAEAVEFPDDQGVAGPELVQELLENRAVGAGAAGGLGEHPVAAGVL
jgi:glycine/D-amino acid oxidase-like deaminating enzyme